jgi:hypothetical protein
MNNENKYESFVAFFDLLFNLMICFVVLFSLAFVLVNEKNKKTQKVDSVAEFLITVTWPEDFNDDVDTYVEDPLGHLVCFRRRDEGLMHLDRDDLGHTNDTVVGPDGTRHEIKENREIVIIRGILPGEYTANAHMFSKREHGRPTTVTVKLEKVNPSLKTITQQEVVLEKNGDEKTAFRFTLDQEGQVISTNDLVKNFTGGGYPNEGEEDYYP